MKKFSTGFVFCLIYLFSAFSLAEDVSSAGGSSEPSTEKVDDSSKDKGKESEEEEEEPDCE